MIREYLKIIGSPVLQYDTGEPLALVQDVIIHPDTGKLEAFWVRPATLPVKHAVLPLEAIVAWKKHLYVKNDQEIALPEDIIRIAEILSRDTRFVGNQVRDEAGTNYGRVYNLDFDDQKLYLRYLYTEKNILGLKYFKNTFYFDQILKVMPEYILIRQDEGRKVRNGESVILSNKQPALDV